MQQQVRGPDGQVLPRCHACRHSAWSLEREYLPMGGKLVCTYDRTGRGLFGDIVPGGCRDFEREPGAEG